MSSKQFTAKTFAWLRQINRGRYLAVDVRIALELTQYFNEKDQGGRAYPGYKTIGDRIGVSEQTVIRSIERMRAQGDLYVIPGKPGRGHPNQYWMTLKTSTAKEVFEGQRKPPSGPKKTSTAMEENHLKNHQDADGECLRTPPSAGERVRASRDENSPPAGAPPLSRHPAGNFDHSEPTTADGEKEDQAFRDLRGVWRRGWPADDTPKALAVARNAYAKARQEVGPEEIIEGARAWLAASEAPRFLPALSQWLAARGWQMPPPTKAKRAHARNGVRYGRKPDWAQITANLVARYEAEERAAAEAHATRQAARAGGAS
jgi:hypothetical protein